MDPRTMQQHDASPQMIWTVIEQPPGTEYRFDYLPDDNQYRMTQSKSLFYDRGFSGAYGWVGGLGYPPGPHFDVILITKRRLNCGDVVSAYLCGVFFRSDGDHKLVALDEELRVTVLHPDITALDAATLEELYKLYPWIGEGEGWFGSQEAQTYLQQEEGHAG